MSEHDEVVELDLDDTIDELVELDFDAECEPVQRGSSVKRGSVVDEISKDAARTARACERVLDVAKQCIYYGLFEYEEMNLVFKMETYFERNKHLGVYWLVQLRRLVRKYDKQLNIAQTGDWLKR